MALSQGSQRHAWLYGVIQAGAAVRASTAEIWSEIRGFAADQGMQLGAGVLQAVNEMRSIATAQRRSAETFNKASADQLFTRAMAAPEINARSQVQQSLTPEYLVRFDLTYMDPAGQQVTRTVSMRDTWYPDMTVQDVHDAVAEAAEGLALDYGNGLVGFGNLRPVSV